jgi:hypothetical protein
MSGYRTIRELVIDTYMSEGEFPSYEKLTSLIKANFTNSKWKESHYNWYKSQIRTGKIKVSGVERNVSDEKENEIRKVKDDVIIVPTRKGNKIYQAKVGLLEDKYWRYLLKDYPIDLLCAIKNGLEESIPLLAEKFNSSNISKAKLFYFGYKKKFNSSLVSISRADYSKDKAYIYIRKKTLRIDLDIGKKYKKDVIKDGFKVVFVKNFQYQAGWLTGWYVPHSTDIKKIMKWLLMAFNR